jgi:hypothetical protein
MVVILELLAKVDWRLYLVVGLMVLVCAVPFAEVFADLWRARFKKRG